MKKIKIFAVFFAFIYISYGQQRVKDDPSSRAQFEVMKTMVPSTGEIPDGIRSRELDFMRSQSFTGRTLGAGTVWSHRGPFNVGGRTRALAVDLDDENAILAGGVSGGLWRSSDAGASWTKRTDVSDLQSVTCIEQDPRSGSRNIWYYGTGERVGNSARGNTGGTNITDANYRGDGIFKSTDGGLSWSVLVATSTDRPERFDNCFDFVYEIIVDPANGDVYVATFCGIHKSINGGDSFEFVRDNLNSSGAGGWTDVAVTSTGVLYAFIDRGDGIDIDPGVYKSVNSGVDWVDITDPNFPIEADERKKIAIAPSAEDTVYIIGEDGTHPSDHTLWMYDDNDGGTATWENRSANIPNYDGIFGSGSNDNPVANFDSQGGYDLLIKVKPDDPNFVIIGGTNLYRSTDGFKTTINSNVANWVGGYSPRNNISTYQNQHPDQHEFVFLSGTKALSGNDGGVQITDDITDGTANGDGETVDWTLLNNGYLTSQVYALSTGPGDQIMSGFQDNGNWLTNSSVGTANWGDDLVNFFGGDGAYNAFNANGTTRYISTQNARIFRVGYSSADDLTINSFDRIDPTSGYNTSLFITPFYLDPIDEEILYLGGDNSFFINTQASSASQTLGWKSIDLPGNTGVVSEFGLTRANRVYVGTSNGKVYSVDNPESLTPAVEEITGANFPSGYVSSIGVNQYDENELIVVFSNYSIPSVFHSNDGGVTWTDIGGNLEENPDGSGSGPSIRATRIMGYGFEYLVGTSTGLYSTRNIDGSNTVWMQESASEIGNVVVNHIVNRNDGLAVVGTHGNGIYSANISPAIDMGVQAVSVPTDGGFNTDETTVQASLLNFGNTAATVFDVTLTINDGLVVTDNVTQSVAPGDSYTHSFSVPFDFSTFGNYDLKITVSIIGDENAANDQFSEEIISQAAPTNITLSNQTIDEGLAVGTLVGTLTTTDEDDSNHTYSLVSGVGGDDNESFSINSSDLLSSEEFDFGVKSDFTIRIQTADDDGNTFAQSFQITVNNILGLEDLEQSGITMFPNPFRNQVSLEMVNDYIGPVGINVLSLDGKEILIETMYDKKSKRTESLLELEDLAVGYYMVQFEFGNTSLSGKLIKK